MGGGGVYLEHHELDGGSWRGRCQKVLLFYYFVEILRVPIGLSYHSKYLVCTEYGISGVYI